jgi:hypothetical protein
MFLTGLPYLPPAPIAGTVNSLFDSMIMETFREQRFYFSQ